jgi:hypothetical protein
VGEWTKELALQISRWCLHVEEGKEMY